MHGHLGVFMTSLLHTWWMKDDQYPAHKPITAYWPAFYLTLQVLDSTPEAVFNIKALAMSGDQKPEGYEAAVYYTPEANSQNTQLIVSQVGEDTNWKMCLDTTVNAHVDAKVDKTEELLVFIMYCC